MTPENISPIHVSPVDNSDFTDKATLICATVIYAMCMTTATVGIITNIINIVCFYKTGFKEPINISLLGLAVSDLGCVTTNLLVSMSFTPPISASDLPFDVTGVAYTVVGFPHLTFSRITTWITAIITLERCLCVAMPLKVGNIVTPKRMAVVIVSVFIIMVACESPAYVVNRLGMRFFPGRNKTLLTLVFTADRSNVQTISFAINNFAMPVLAFMVIILCTIILVVNLHANTNWRKSTTAGDSNFSNRNLKICKMVVMISALFISCFIPVTITMLAVAFVPDIAVGGTDLDIGLIAVGAGLLSECINSSSNMYIYYYMSSRFKSMCRSVFCKNKFS